MPATVSLPPNKTYPLRQASWEHLPLSGCGVLEISERKRVDSRVPRIRRYFVQPLGVQPGEIGFRLKKPCGDDETHFVCLRPENQSDECTCTGYLQGGICTHIQALRKLRDGGFLLRKK